MVRSIRRFKYWTW